MRDLNVAQVTHLKVLYVYYTLVSKSLIFSYG